MRASLLIAAHNEGPALFRTVRSALAAAVGLDCEIVLANDASTDDAVVETMAAFPQVRLVENVRRCGVSATKDLAARHARGEVLLFLDGHTQPEPGALLRLVEDVEATDGNAIVTPAVPHLDVRTWTNSRTQVGHGFTMRLDTFACGWTGLSTMKEHRVGRRVLYETPALIGCALAVSRRVYEELRGFDPHMRSWGLEDLDFGLKAWLCGHPLLHDPQAIVGHRFRASFDNFSVPADHIVVNELRMARKHFTNPHWTEWLERARARHVGNDSPTPALPNPHTPLSRLEHPEGRWAHLWMQFLEDRQSVEQERAYLLSRRVHDEVWFAKRFGLDWPVWPTEKKKPCGCGGAKESPLATAFGSSSGESPSPEPSPSPSPMPSPSPSPCPCEVESVDGPKIVWLGKTATFTISGSCMDEISVSVTGGQITQGPSGTETSQTVTIRFTQLGQQTVTASCNDTSASITVNVCAVDIRVDSNNDGSITDSDDLIEEQNPGKVALVVNDIVDPDTGAVEVVERDLIECQLTVKTGGASVDWSGATAQLTVSGSFQAWRDTNRTIPFPLGQTFPAADLPQVAWLEAMQEGTAFAQLEVKPQGGAAGNDKAKVKAVKNTPGKIETKETYEFTAADRTQLQNEMNLERRAKLFEDIVKREFKAGDFDSEGVFLYFAPTMQQVDPTHTAGYAGFVMAWDPRGKAKDGGTAYDFSGTRIRFMAYRFSWNPDKPHKPKIRFPNGTVVAGPSTEGVHEKWHTEGLPPDFYKTVSGITFQNTKPQTGTAYPNKPGYRGAATIFKARLLTAWNLEKAPNPGKLTDADAEVVALDLAKKWFMGCHKEILAAGSWHGNLTANGDYEYNTEWWYPPQVK